MDRLKNLFQLSLAFLFTSACIEYPGKQNGPVGWRGNLPEIMASPQGYVKGRIRSRTMLENGYDETDFKKRRSPP